MSFLPDATYQENEIARIYEDSIRISAYLGDWHTASQRKQLSKQPRQANTKANRGPSGGEVSNPSYGGAGGGDDDRFMRLWKYQPQSRPKELFVIKVESMLLKRYSHTQ